VAAKTLALGLTELFTHPEAVAAAREEFERRRGEHFKYEPLLGDRSPPLDYRGK
jgi:aminobenzoyl-glutamate utilization protein B